MEAGGAAVTRRMGSSISLRIAEPSDWPYLRSLVRQLHERTIFADMTFSETKFDEIEARLKRPHLGECVLVAEAEGQIVGGAWFSAGHHILSETSLMTTVHIVAVDVRRCRPFRAAKVFIRLVRGIVAWSRSRKAKRVLIHVTTGDSIAATHRLIQAGGAQLIGGGYMVMV